MAPPFVRIHYKVWHGEVSLGGFGFGFYLYFDIDSSKSYWFLKFIRHLFFQQSKYCSQFPSMPTAGTIMRKPALSPLLLLTGGMIWLKHCRLAEKSWSLDC